MNSFAPIGIVKEARLPLNSFCDRFELEGLGDCSGEIVDYLNFI